MGMIQLLINWLLACVMLPDTDAFIQCVDNVVMEYNHIVEVNEMVENDVLIE